MEDTLTVSEAVVAGTTVETSGLCNGTEAVKVKDVNPFGDTLVSFEIELNDVDDSDSETTQVQMLQLMEDRYGQVRTWL